MSSIVTGSLWSPQEQDEQRSGSGVDILANCPTFCQTSMALRELARKGAGLVARVESQPALQTFARAMTAKVNQVTGAPMELYEKRKVRTPASLPSSRRGKPYFQPSARPDSARRGLDGVARGRRRRTSVDAVVVGVVAVFGVGVGAFAAVLLSLSRSSPDR